MATRFEFHVVATIDHGTDVSTEQVTAFLDSIEHRVKDLGGDVSITFARTTRGQDGDAKEPAHPKVVSYPTPGEQGFL